MNRAQSTWRGVFPTSTVPWRLSPNTAAPGAQEGPGWPPGPPPPLATSCVLADHGVGGGSLALPRAAPGPHSSARLAQGRLLGLHSWRKSGSHEDGLPPPRPWENRGKTGCGVLDSSLTSASHLLCGPGQVTSPLWASSSPSITQADNQPVSSWGSHWMPALCPASSTTDSGSRSGDPAPQGTWAMSGNVCGCHDWGAPGVDGVGVKDAAPHPPVPRMASYREWSSPESQRC